MKDLIKKQKKQKKIISFDADKNLAFELDGDKLLPKDFDSISKKDEFLIGYIKQKDLIFTTLEVRKGTPADEVEGTLYEQAYRELSLDQKIDYMVKFEPLKDKHGYYNVFIAPSNEIDGTLAALVEKSKYIDAYVPAAKLFSAAYASKALPANGADVFLYFWEDDALLALYKDGELVQTRSLGRYNLGYINARLGELTGARKEIKEFLSNLKSGGVSALGEEASPILDDVFYYVSDLLSSVSKTTNLNIQKVYLGTQIGVIPGLAQFVQNRILLETKDFILPTKIAQKELDPSLMHVLACLYAKYCADTNFVNFSNFIRPPEFFKRDGGKFLALCGAACVLSLAYPCYQLAHGYLLGLETENVTASTEVKKAKVDSLNAQLKALNAGIERVKKESAQVGKTLETKEELLAKSHALKVSYPMKSVALVDMSRFINDVGVKSERIKINGNQIVVSVISSDDKQITQLVKNINDSAKYGVWARQIAFGGKYFESNITVEMK